MNKIDSSPVPLGWVIARWVRVSRLHRWIAAITSSTPVESRSGDAPTDTISVRSATVRSTSALSTSARSAFPLGTAILFVVTVAVCAGLDLYTKHIVFQSFFDPAAPFQEPTWWLSGVLGVQTSTNPGALFGFGRGYSLWFAGISVVFFGFILAWIFGFGGIRDRFLTFALALICGGIFGNFYDRIGWGYLPEYPEEIRHHVRDWILFRLEGVPGFDPWPNFNLADSFLVIGAAALIFHSLFLQKSIEPSTSNGESGVKSDRPNESTPVSRE